MGESQRTLLGICISESEKGDTGRWLKVRSTETGKRVEIVWKENTLTANVDLDVEFLGHDGSCASSTSSTCTLILRLALVQTLPRW